MLLLLLRLTGNVTTSRGITPVYYTTHWVPGYRFIAIYDEGTIVSRMASFCADKDVSHSLHSLQ